MTRDEIKSEVASANPLGKYMIGTTANHIMGDLSRKSGDLFYAKLESEKFYIGQWSTGFGFFNVCFPKETSRPLTAEEVEKYNSMSVQLANYAPVKLKVD